MKASSFTEGEKMGYFKKTMDKVHPSYKKSRSYLQKKYVPPQKCARTCGDDKIMSKGIKENTGKTHLGNDLCGT